MNDKQDMTRTPLADSLRRLNGGTTVVNWKTIEELFGHMMNEICNRCGGVKSATFLSASVTATYQPGLIMPINPSATQPLTASTVQICYCVPEPHDGKLDNYAASDSTYKLQLQAMVVVREKDISAYGKELISISGGYGDCEHTSIKLDAAQFESLMQWGEQNRERVRQMAKEQE